MSETFATLEAPAGKLNRLMELASGGYHDDVYMKVQDDSVHTLMQTGGRNVSSFGTFYESYFDLLEGDAEAFVPTEQYHDYLDVAAGEGSALMTFLGTEDNSDHPRLAVEWTVSGGMHCRVRLPGSTSDMNAVPWALPPRFNDNNQFISQDCFDDDWALLEEFEDPADQKVPPTDITVDAETFETNVVAKSEFAGGGDAPYYPVTVEDETLTFDFGKEAGENAIWGDVDTVDVSGPDVSNTYLTGISEVIDSLSGTIRLSTAPTKMESPDAPLVVVQESDHYTIRHVLASYSA